MKILNWFKCLFGHIPEYYFTQTESYYWIMRCKRCKHPLGIPKMRMYDLPCPGVDKKEWVEFCDQKIADIKAMVKAKILKQ